MELEELFKVYGFSQDEFKFLRYNEKNINIKSSVLGNNLNSIYVFFKDKGYDENVIFNFVKYNPDLLSCSDIYLKSSWSNLIKFGYKKEEVFKMVKHKPTVLIPTISDIMVRFEDLKRIGYTDYDIKVMSINTPSILVQPLDQIKSKIYHLIERNYKIEEAIRITSIQSTIFDYSYDSIDQRLDLYDSINMHNLVYKKPIILRQSPKLTYARYHYYLDHNIEVNEQKYKKLFISEKQFINIHKINNIELMNKYPYNEEVLNKSKQKKY